MKYRITAEFDEFEMELITGAIHDKISETLQAKVELAFAGEKPSDWYDKHIEWVEGIKKKLGDSILRVEEEPRIDLFYHPFIWAHIEQQMCWFKISAEARGYQLRFCGPDKAARSKMILRKEELDGSVEEITLTLKDKLSTTITNGEEEVVVDHRWLGSALTALIWKEEEEKP